jgi:hypothetical protein
MSGSEVMSAARLALAVLRCIPPDKINPKEYWSRAKDALEYALETGEAVEEVASLMARKLQVEAIHPDPYSSICSVAAEVVDFEAWRRAALSSALMVIAHARAMRDAERGNDTLPWQGETLRMKT